MYFNKFNSFMNINRIDSSLDYLDDSLSYLNLAIIDNEFVAAISLVNIEKQITALDSSIKEVYSYVNI